MTLSPILKALSSMRTSGAGTLLMGGQACVLYGAAEFSRDLDILIGAEPKSLSNLQKALHSLEAVPIALPPLTQDFLDRGHAVHFRCHREDVKGLRIDVMSKLRGVDGFEALWARRSTIISEDAVIDVLAIQDLVRAKKTQRDKDWPMIRRLVEETYFSLPADPGRLQIDFLLSELRTPELLLALASRFPQQALEIAAGRPAVRHSISQELSGVSTALAVEEATERAADRLYWEPLKRELEQLRLALRTPET